MPYSNWVLEDHKPLKVVNIFPDGYWRKRALERLAICGILRILEILDLVLTVLLAICVACPASILKNVWLWLGLEARFGTFKAPYPDVFWSIYWSKVLVVLNGRWPMLSWLLYL